MKLLHHLLISQQKSKLHWPRTPRLRNAIATGSIPEHSVPTRISTPFKALAWGKGKSAVVGATRVSEQWAVAVLAVVGALFCFLLALAMLALALTALALAFNLMSFSPSRRH